MTLDDGLVYAGQILNGKPHGSGQIIKSSGEKFYVVFRNGVVTGIFHNIFVYSILQGLGALGAGSYY